MEQVLAGGRTGQQLKGIDRGLPLHQSKALCNCQSLVLILILISIKTRIDNIFGQKPPPHPTPPTHRELNLA